MRGVAHSATPTRRRRKGPSPEAARAEMKRTGPRPHYSIQRFSDGAPLSKVERQGHRAAAEILKLVCGFIPGGFGQASHPGQEWKISLGEGHWLVVRRDG